MQPRCRKFLRAKLVLVVLEIKDIATALKPQGRPLSRRKDRERGQTAADVWESYSSLWSRMYPQ